MYFVTFTTCFSFTGLYWGIEFILLLNRIKKKMPQKKHTQFKFYLVQLLKYLSKEYPEYSNFKMYDCIINSMNLQTIEVLFNDIQGTVLEYKKEINDRDENFFLHLKPKVLTGNFIIINEISNIRNLYHLPKTTETHKNQIWEYIIKIANTFSK